MGEAKRRKKLDPNYGKKYRFADLSTKSKKKPQTDLEYDRVDSFEEQDYLDFDDEDEDFDGEDENENLDSSMIRYQYAYELEVKTSEGKTISDVGRSELVKHVEEYQFGDDGVIFGEVLQVAIQDFYAFEFEKHKYGDISEVTVSIKELKIE